MGHHVRDVQGAASDIEHPFVGVRASRRWEWIAAAAQRLVIVDSAARIMRSYAQHALGWVVLASIRPHLPHRFLHLQTRKGADLPSSVHTDCRGISWRATSPS